jgi:hypothetical protein
LPIGFLGLIDFRYHVASIVSIFLALTVGIVLGTSLLQEPALRTTQDLTAQLATTKEELRTQIKALERLQAENDATTYDKAAMLLGSALMTNDPAQAGTRDKETFTVLDEFERAGLLSIDREPGRRATIAVMIAPEDPFEGENTEAQAGALVSLAARLDAASRGTVLAGGATSTTPGGLIAALRDKNETVKHVTAIDTADTPLGRITVVHALREQLSGRAGQYGTGTGASSFPLTTSLSTPSPRR